jgi:hypothetical protein
VVRGKWLNLIAGIFVELGQRITRIDMAFCHIGRVGLGELVEDCSPLLGELLPLVWVRGLVQGGLGAR